MSKVIFITGASRGLGQIWAEGFLTRGDKIVATARNIASLNGMVEQFGESVLPLELDINDRASAFASVKKAREHFGSIDVLINNAGYDLMGAVEEIKEQEARQQFDTNFFGTLWMTQAVIPIMREQGSGHIVNVSSLLGLIALPIFGIYSASKYAVEGLTESLAGELQLFGIKVSLIESSGYATDISQSSPNNILMKSLYDEVKSNMFTLFGKDFLGDPRATINALFQLIDSPNPPLRLLLGKKGLPMIQRAYENRLTEFDEWKEVSVAAHGR